MYKLGAARTDEDRPQGEVLLGTPNAHERTHTPRQVDHGAQLANQIAALLPTPTAREFDHTDVDGYLERREREKAKGRNGNGFGLMLGMAVKLMPTPTAGDGKSARNDTSEDRGWERGDRHSGTTLTDAADTVAQDWGEYEPAIRRWEEVVGRPAPAPVDDRGRLAAGFVEWMMGFQQGWVQGLARTAALRCLGNAVVPQQGALALRILLEAEC